MSLFSNFNIIIIQQTSKTHKFSDFNSPLKNFTQSFCLDKSCCRRIQYLLPYEPFYTIILIYEYSHNIFFLLQLSQKTFTHLNFKEMISNVFMQFQIYLCLSTIYLGQEELYHLYITLLVINSRIFNNTNVVHWTTSKSLFTKWLFGLTYF